VVNHLTVSAILLFLHHQAFNFQTKLPSLLEQQVTILRSYGVKQTTKNMGRQTGAVTFTGKFGNMVGYTSEGKHLVRTPGGQTKAQILANPNTKANVDEFTLLQQAVSTLRLGLVRAIAKTRNSKLQAQLSTRLTAIRNTSPQPKGERTVAEGTNFDTLQDFRISKKSIASVLVVPLNSKWDKANAKAQLIVPAITPSLDILPPSSAAKFSLSFVAAELDLAGNKVLSSGGVVHIDKQDLTSGTAIAGATAELTLSNTANSFIIGAVIVEFFNAKSEPLGLQENASIISLATKNA
jgi:hypothetical protein